MTDNINQMSICKTKGFCKLYNLKTYFSLHYLYNNTNSAKKNKYWIYMEWMIVYSIYSEKDSY